MAKETTYEEIARELKNRIYKPVYYLMGEESYYIDRISEYIAQTVLNENEKEAIKRFSQGEALFVCGNRRMQINVIVTEDELESFGTGGGF